MMLDLRFAAVLAMTVFPVVACVSRENAGGPHEQTATVVSAPASTKGAELPSSTTMVAAAPPPSGGEQPWVEPTRDVTTPLQVSVRGPATVAGNEEFDLTIELARSVANDTPIELTVTVPPGARLVSGTVHETIVDATNKTVSRILRLKLDRVPDQDLQVVADMKGSGFGVHAQGAYRFGRPEQKLPAVHVVPGGKRKLGGGIPAN